MSVRKEVHPCKSPLDNLYMRKWKRALWETEFYHVILFGLLLAHRIQMYSVTEMFEFNNYLKVIIINKISMIICILLLFFHGVRVT